MIKTILLFTLSLFVSTYSEAQYDGKGPNEASRFRPGIMWFYHGIGQAEEGKTRKYDRLIFDITYNDWTGDIKPFKGKPTSLGFGTNFMFDVPITVGNTMSFGWGFNHHWTHIRHDATFYHNLTEESTEFSLAQVQGKSALNYHQISIPLELRFRNESWKHLKLHIGGKVGYLFGMHEITKLNNTNGKTIIKDYNFQDKNALQYSAHVRFGLRNYALFGEYNISSLFSNSKSTQLNVIKMGISISLF